MEVSSSEQAAEGGSAIAVEENEPTAENIARYIESYMYTFVQYILTHTVCYYIALYT